MRGRVRSQCVLTSVHNYCCVASENAQSHKPRGGGLKVTFMQVNCRKVTFSHFWSRLS